MTYPTVFQIMSYHKMGKIIVCLLMGLQIFSVLKQTQSANTSNRVNSEPRHESGRFEDTETDPMTPSGTTYKPDYGMKQHREEEFTKEQLNGILSKIGKILAIARKQKITLPKIKPPIALARTTSPCYGISFLWC